jgi:hypothetical protein
MPIAIFHGYQDEVVPLEQVRAIAEQIFMNLKFNTVEDDHFLQETFATLEWDKLLNLHERGTSFLKWAKDDRRCKT